MKPEDFHFQPLMKRLSDLTASGWTESQAFVLWFLMNIFRLDETVAQDAICDGKDDKGIDALYVDDDQEIVFVIQSKLAQNPAKALGDTDLKEFAGTLTQMGSAETLQQLIDDTQQETLRRVVIDSEAIEKIAHGYAVSGVFITNRSSDPVATSFLKIHGNIKLYDRDRLAESVIDVDYDRSIDEEFTFDVSYAGVLEHQSGTDVKMAIAPISALELVKLNGISDGTLFQRNVRLNLGSTKVNKDIADTIKSASEHDRFILYHNVVTMLCQGIFLDEGAEKLTIAGYSVVNGAQSLTTLFRNSANLTSDLRVLVKFIALQDEELSDRITWNSNNQNAIKYRDQRSNDLIQRRLQKEFEEIPELALEVKRGGQVEGKSVISNEEAGLLLLAYDLKEPWVCHQKYKIFDERYHDIFARQTVTANYILFIHKIMEVIARHVHDVENEKVRRYALTKYFMLYCMRLALEANPIWSKIRNNPSYLLENSEKMSKFNDSVDNILKGLVYDLNGEIADQADFDHKDVFKSPEKSRQLANSIVGVYRKELKRGKVEPVDI